MNCFVMMPSGNHNEYQGGQEEAEFIFNGIIKPALQEALGEEAKINREIDNRKPGAITSAIIHQIAESDIAVVDITGQNPNVFFELGMRYSLRRATTIILRQHETPIPFDIKGHRCIVYSPYFGGIDKAKNDIKEALIQAREQATSTKICDSLVFEVLQNLEVVIPSPDGRFRNFDNIMPWQVYQNSLQKVIEAAINIIRDGRYVPISVLGITNGGAMFADLLTRELFTGSVPTICLWADRTNHSGYFDNKINHSIITGIKDISQGVQNASVLLVDDIIASGTTQHQAINFLKGNLENIDIRFLPLVSRNEKYFDLVKENILWKHPVFNVSDKEITAIHHTEWSRLPYGKDIRSS